MQLFQVEVIRKSSSDFNAVMDEAIHAATT
jgi:hypothetical protein